MAENAVMTFRNLCFIVAVLMYSPSYVAALEDLNYTEAVSYVPVIGRYGDTLYMSDKLYKRLEEEEATWHWMPWTRTKTKVSENLVKEVCSDGDSIESFPDSLFDDDQLRNGAVVVYIILAIYSFSLLALVCNDFFIPCVELICEDLKIPHNVAAATFMAVATSCPEFFVNVISTFLTESAMGIGTIVGSAIFNALGVAAVGGLAASSPIQLEMRPLTRDVIIYMFNVGVLVAIVWDGQIDWYEALILGILYILYFIIMFNSMRMFDWFDRVLAKNCKKGPENHDNISNGKPVEEGLDNKAYFENETKTQTTNNVEKIPDVPDNEVKPKSSIWRYPKEKTILKQIMWLYLWPIRFVLKITIPSPTMFKRIYPLSFFFCIIWIGANSYLISWSMTVIGHTFFIPDAVMGMTFLAFGGCLPEACSIFIMSRRGEGGIGVSNALGANSLAILFALGIPWLIRTLTLLGQGAEVTVVAIDSEGIDFVVGSLLLAVACLWLALYASKFRLQRSIGVVFCVLYIAFITFAILVGLGLILGIETAFC